MSRQSEILSKAAFARRCGRTSAAIALASKPGKALAPALVLQQFDLGAPRHGIDTGHPAARAYLERAKGRPSRNKSPAKTKRKRSRAGRPSRAEIVAELREVEAARPDPVPRPRDNERAVPPPTAAIEVPEHITTVLDWKVRDVVEQFGTAPLFLDWLKAAKVIEEVAERRIKVAVARGDLIDRDTVRVHVMPAIDDAMQRLLTDSPRTIAARVTELVEAGAEVSEVERVIRDLISTQIRAMKSRAKRGIERDGAE